MADTKGSDSVKEALEIVKKGRLTQLTAELVAKAIVDQRCSIYNIESYIGLVKICKCHDRKPDTEEAQKLASCIQTEDTSIFLQMCLKGKLHAVDAGKVAKMIENRVNLVQQEACLKQFVDTCICKLKTQSNQVGDRNDAGDKNTDSIADARHFIERVLLKCKDPKQSVSADEAEQAIAYLHDHEKQLRHYMQKAGSLHQSKDPQPNAKDSRSRGDLKAHENDISDLKEKLQERTDEVEKYKQRYEDLMKSYDQLRVQRPVGGPKPTTGSKHDGKNRDIVSDLENKLRRKAEQIDKLEEKVRLTNIENNDLKNRLSVMLGQKMTENNPEIADLSDPFRPTSLVEKFKQIYDEEWTPAYEDLEKEMSETKVVESLTIILQSVDEFCTGASFDQMQELERAAFNILTDPGVKKKRSSVRSELSTEEAKIAHRHLKDMRKALATASVKPLVNIYGNLNGSWLKSKSKRVTEHINDFTEKSLRIIWLMKVQDPPMVLVWQKPGEPFDKARFFPYTKKGDKVAYCVWPAVLLHEIGPLMGKGVAQGC